MTTTRNARGHDADPRCGRERLPKSAEAKDVAVSKKAAVAAAEDAAWGRRGAAAQRGGGRGSGQRKVRGQGH